MKTIKLTIEFEPTAGITDINNVITAIEKAIIKADSKWAISKFNPKIEEK